jgi:hypothetical protein
MTEIAPRLQSESRTTKAPLGVSEPYSKKSTTQIERAANREQHRGKESEPY